MKASRWITGALASLVTLGKRKLRPDAARQGHTLGKRKLSPDDLRRYGDYGRYGACSNSGAFRTSGG